MDERSNASAMSNYSFLVMFANDDVVDAEELAFLEKLALADQFVDDDEKAVLRRIFARVDDRLLAPAVREEIERFKIRYAI